MNIYSSMRACCLATAIAAWAQPLLAQDSSPKSSAETIFSAQKIFSAQTIDDKVQIGYGVDFDFRGKRYAARACRLLFHLARCHGMSQLWITCNPENVASRRTCELVGGVLVDIVDVPSTIDVYREGDRQKCRYRIRL